MEGALARIGVNVGPLAGYVASRCGFQPAVLIRFGAVLLARLQRTRSASERESIAVTEEDVIETFNGGGFRGIELHSDFFLQC